MKAKPDHYKVRGVSLPESFWKILKGRSEAKHSNVSRELRDAFERDAEIMRQAIGRARPQRRDEQREMANDFRGELK